MRGIGALTGERMHLEPRVTLPLRWPFGFLKATAAYRYTEYSLKSDPPDPWTTRSPNRAMATGSVDGGLIFERDLDWFDCAPGADPGAAPFLPVPGIRRTRSHLPLFDGKALTVGYLQLFRENRFSGLDRMGDANRLTGGRDDAFLRPGQRQGVLSRQRRADPALLRPAGHPAWQAATGRPPRHLGHGGREISGRLAGRWKLAGSLVWDPNDNQIDEASGMLQFQLDGRRVINLGYRNRLLQDIDQTDMSFYWTISRPLCGVRALEPRPRQRTGY